MCKQGYSEVEADAVKNVYPFLIDYLKQWSRLPTCAITRDELGYSSTSVVHDRYKSLLGLGWLGQNDQTGHYYVTGARISLGRKVRRRLKQAEEV